ncbi:MAG TPA: hypothetical protein VFJ58_15480 [Armatimonadota bacterium]|nr:hypothetical protein [Armatimonadota bacterium]
MGIGSCNKITTIHHHALDREVKKTLGRGMTVSQIYDGRGWIRRRTLSTSAADDSCGPRWRIVRWIIAVAMALVADVVALLVTWLLLFTARSFAAVVVICLLLALLTGMAAVGGYLLWRSGQAALAVAVWLGCILYAAGAIYILTNPGMVF